ncbi:DUF4234 domain-containing protein [uncultured Nocardioides sp.]|uniref:DUF4234 domain-containing protein n=1 Tax=uncultured Nocardioides sp. TaxID=198441 RepID=UPI002635AC2E|nr:DUF4234 domain-containing protein [uncultured Nocardioides sp.]
MTDANEPAPNVDDQSQPVAPPPAPAAPPMPVGAAVPAYAGAVGPAPLGKIRSTGTCFLLTIVTLGFYSWYWYYATHDEMKRHTGDGIGGGLALVLAIFVGIVMPFLNSNEVGRLYERRGQAKPVSAMTGLWALLLGWFFFVGLIVWFVKTNGALNDYWRSLGAQG